MKGKAVARLIGVAMVACPCMFFVATFVLWATIMVIHDPWILVPTGAVLLAIASLIGGALLVDWSNKP